MSNFGIWFLIIFVCIILPQMKERTGAVAHHHIKKKHRKELNVMNKIVMSYVGKECIIYAVGSSGIITGVIESIEDGWVSVKSFDGQTTEAVNAEYITRIQEYPKNKNGKRKAIWA